MTRNKIYFSHLKMALALVATSALLLACGPTQNSGQNGVASSGTVVASGAADIGGDFNLTDHSGAAFTQDNLLGQPSLVYFGFSFCPDVCPTALQKMGALQAALGKSEGVENSGALRYVFISVDAERDTPGSLAPYVASRGFPEGLIGLSGTQTQVDTAVAAYRVYAKKVDDPQSAAEYSFDHSDLIFLMDAKGDFTDVFTRNTTIAQMVAQIESVLNK